jgi:fructose-specific phosphotransferase system component IIB
MESIIRNVSDIQRDEKRIYEAVLGQKLKDNQQIIIQIINLGEKTTPEPSASTTEEQAGKTLPSLPDWCNVYEGLTDEEIADAETVILTRSDMSRPSQ